MAMKYELPHMGGNTISTKLTAKLIDELRFGDFKNDDRLPSEVELAERYKVSRSVIRDVLSNLEREGFVERGRGIGTLIHRDIVNLENRLDLKYEYYQLIRGVGAVPSCDNVRLHEKPADEELAVRLDIDVGETVIVCEKRILANGKPVIYSIDHLPQQLFGNIDYKMLAWDTPVFDLLEEYCGIVVDTDIASLQVVNATESWAKTLEVPAGQALFFVDEVGYYKLSRPIIQTFGYYTNFFNFAMLRKKF